MEKLFEGVSTLHYGKIGSREEVPVSSLEGPGKVLGLYFSAHWCPPCNLFTPELVGWYNRLRTSGKDIQVVFISFDNNEEDYEEHFSTMDWLGLPFKHREIKANLVRKYKISGVPSLILINAHTSSLISKDGRYYVLNDRDGDGFPWTPETLEVCLSSGFLEDKEGLDLSWVDIKDSFKVLGLFFSAQWCQPCESFTSLLISFYDKMKKKFPSQFEVIFVSSDHEESTFKEYALKMPWITVPFKDKKCQKLRQIYNISDIPTLVIVNPQSGDVITDNGRTMVTIDPNGLEFPWYPKPLEILDEASINIVNDNVSLVLFTDGSPDQVQMALALLSPVAEEYFKNNSGRDDKDSIKFFYSNDSDLSASLREEVLKIPEVFPLLTLIDIPSQRKYVCDTNNINEDTIASLLSSFNNDTIQWSKLN